ncbi:MAG: type VII secretion protein EssC [Bacilli bacterium]|nr:type VII secretion protein EssC [Bacilli bacterium]
MRISLLKEEKLLVYNLPEKVEGNYWLSETDNNGIEKNIINVESTSDGKWKLVSNSDYYVADNSKKIPFALLGGNNIYTVNHAYSLNNLLLFTSPSYEKDMKYYNCTNNINMGISIGRNEKCTITFGLNYVGDTDLIIKSENNIITLFAREGKYNVFVNGKKVIGKTQIESGDTIFYLGLQITFLIINNDYIIGVNNPFNTVKAYLPEYNIKKHKGNKVEEQDEDKEMELYSQEDYFYRKPRFKYTINEYKIRVDEPPTKEDGDEMPAILTVGPMLTMSLTSIITMYTTINNINNGNQTAQQALPQLVIGGVMILSCLFWPMIISAFSKHLKKKKEKKRQLKYGEYVDSIKTKLNNQKKIQEDLYHKRFPSLIDCEKIIQNKEDRLYEKRVYDEDFLEISLGTGTLPMNVDVDLPGEHFSLAEDVMLNKLDEIKNYRVELNNVPIPFSLRENFISAIIGKPALQQKMINNILLQLMTFQSYESLKISVFTSKDKARNWDSLKTLPHIWTNGMNMRFFATDEKEYKEVTYVLDHIYADRLEKIGENNDATLESFNELYLIIVDTYTAVRNMELFNHIIGNKKYLGFSVLILNDRISNLPDQCQTFIELEETESKVSKNISNSTTQKFKIDMTPIELTKCVTKLSSIPLELKNEGEGAIPKKVGFLEMFGLGKIEQFNSKLRWKENTPIKNMSVPVGIGNNDEKITLDIHEKYHGPHGLIAGMTGSGKSEFIITYILSLAVTFHPYEVQFILIDYKGGGLAGAFENQSIGIKLPHLVGVITNLDKNEINRSLASIESELKRRQALFNKAREASEESTIDIYKYQEMYRKGIVDEPISHLLIIADEFAELKQQQPEFMEQLISTARIGRSLGVHLILATQKPSGVVDSQIWSNTRFRVCLRVQETGDSSEVIKRPDAAYLTTTGRFYLQVGFNEVFVLGQSAWAGGKYLPSENIKKNIDTSVSFVDNNGYIKQSIETRKEEEKFTVNLGQELINIVKYLSSIAVEENIKASPLWLSRIPNEIFVGDLIKKYSYTKKDFVLNPVIGEYDLPEMQEQRLLTIPFSEEGNMLVYGIAGSGKENFITTMIFSSMVAYSPMEVNYYILDFGSETLKYFEKSPYVGDVIYTNDSEKIDNLFKMVNREIEDRKKLFSDYNGDYLTYCNKSGNTLPNIVIVINNYEGFTETYSDYEDTFGIITRDCTKYGIYFALSVGSPNGVRFKVAQNFGQTFCLQQNNDDDYSSVLGNVKKVFPSKTFGRGLIKPGNAYEFQTAFVTNKDDIPEYIRKVNEQLSVKFNYHAKKIPVLPETVIYSELDIPEGNKKQMVIGVNKEDLTPVTYSFEKNLINIITSNDDSLFEKIITPLIHQFIYKKTYNNFVINVGDIEFDEIITKGTNYVTDNFDKVFETLKNYIESSNKKYDENNRDKSIFNGVQKVNCIIIGVNEFKNKLSEDNQNVFGDLFKDENELKLINFIIIDTEDKIKKYAYDEWFKNGFTPNCGIYVGNGIDNQMIINIGKRIPEMREEIDNNFGFVVNKGTPICVKFVERYK